MQGFVGKGLLLLASGALAAGAAEVALRLIGYAPLTLYREQLNFWQYDATLGWKLRPGQSGSFRSPHFTIKVRNNRRSLRDREYAYERTATRRVLVLGDSFTWGYGVEEDERFTELLESGPEKWEVINAGISGYSTDQELIWFESEGVKYRPDLVVLVFCGNDEQMNRERLVYDIYFKPRFRLEGTNLVLENVPVPRARWRTRLVYGLKRRSALARLLSDRWFTLREAWCRGSAAGVGTRRGSVAIKENGTFAKEKKEEYLLTRALIARLQAGAENIGAGFLVVTLPRWWTSPGTYEEFVEYLRQDGHDVLDVEALAEFDFKSMTIPGDGHWNAAGHRFVAEQIRKHIHARRLLE